MESDIPRVGRVIGPVDRVNETNNQGKEKNKKPFDLEEETESKKKRKKPETEKSDPVAQEDLPVSPPEEGESGSGLDVVA